MNQHKIQINVTLDREKMPEHIDWQASGSSEPDMPQAAKAFLLSLWDGKEKTALRIDLWTKRMMVDEMNDFFFQTLMTMADTYGRATRNAELAEELRVQFREFKKKADELLTQSEDGPSAPKEGGSKRAE